MVHANRSNHSTTLPYCLAIMPCSLLRPPSPIFGQNHCIGLFYLHYMPPAGHSSQFAVLQSLHVYVCCMCRRVVFVYQACRNSLRTGLGLISDSFLRPVILHAILLCSLTAGGRSLPAMFCKWPTTLPSFSTAKACRWKEFSSSTAQQNFVDTNLLEGGGLTVM